MNLTPQFSIKIRLRKIRNSHIQSKLSKCLKCIARACGAQIVSWPEPRGDAGTEAGTMEMKRSGEEYFTCITEHEDPRAHTMLLHSKETLRSRTQLLGCHASVPQCSLGPPAYFWGGASELAHALTEKSKPCSIVWNNGQTGLLSSLMP